MGFSLFNPAIWIFFVLLWWNVSGRTCRFQLADSGVRSVRTAHEDYFTSSSGSESSILTSTVRTVYVTDTSTILHTASAGISQALLIHQTQPLHLHASVPPTKIRTLVPEVAAISFSLYTLIADRPVSVLGEATLVKSNSGQTPTPAALLSETPISPSLTLSSSAIAGISLGAVALVGIFIGVALCLHRRRNLKTSASSDNKEAAKQERITQARSLRQNTFRQDKFKHRCVSDIMQSKQRFENTKANMAAKNNDKAPKKEEEAREEDETFVITDDGMFEMAEESHAEYDRSRRPSGLAMHPPTLKDLEAKTGDGMDVGQAM